MRGASNKGLIPAYIQAARVVDVDPAKWTMSLYTEIMDRTFYNVPIPAPYLHPFEGEGIVFIPEVGAHCWVAIPSEGDTRPVPLTFRSPVNQEGTFAGGRKKTVNPGSIHLSTRDRNGIKVERGGVVEIYSTPIARTFYLPYSNEIVHFFENYRLEGLGGYSRWLTSRPEEDPDGLKGTRLEVAIKEFADHPGHVVRVQAGGQIEDDNGAVVKLDVHESGEASHLDEVPSTTVTINKLGEIRVSNGAMDLLIDDDGKVYMTSSDVRIHLGTGASVGIYDTSEGLMEGVILGKTFLTALSLILPPIISLVAGLLGAGTAAPLLEFQTKVGLSLVSDPKGGAPFISTKTTTE